MGTVFFDGSGTNSVVVLVQGYSAGCETPDLHRVYSGFGSMDDAIAYAKKLAGKVKNATETVSGGNVEQSFVRVSCKNGSTMVFQCLAAENVSVA